MFGSANARARQAKRDRKSDMVTHITSKYIRLTLTMPTWYNSKYKKNFSLAFAYACCVKQPLDIPWFQAKSLR